VVPDAVDGRARHGVPEPGGLEAGSGASAPRFGWANQSLLPVLIFGLLHFRDGLQQLWILCNFGGLLLGELRHAYAYFININ